MSAQLAARIFAGLTGLVVAFQLALALGAPWGEFAMGGAFPGVYPPAMRLLAVLQAVVLAGVAVVVLCRAGLVLSQWRGVCRLLIWAVVGIVAVAVVLNLVTPSAVERLIWAPVASALFVTSLRVALARSPAD